MDTASFGLKNMVGDESMSVAELVYVRMPDLMTTKREEEKRKIFIETTGAE